MMDFLWWFEILFVIFCVVQLVRLILADGDLTLMWKEKFGLKPEVLHGQVVWITGASSGIGEYLAYELAKVGCKLILSARRQPELDKVKKQCLLTGRLKEDDILVLPLDLLDCDTHQAATDQVIKHFGKIDVLVNNGGRSQRALAIKTKLEVDRQMFDLNVLGTLSLTKIVLPHMVSRKQGQIVVTSSVAGKIGAPLSATYTATKHALQGWFDAARLELVSDNIGMTMVCPGPVFSEAITHAFTENPGEEKNRPMDRKEKRVQTDRCAYLMAVAMANRLDEVWIALHPVLLFAYVGVYLPAISKSLAKKMGTRLISSFREGQK